MIKRLYLIVISLSLLISGTLIWSSRLKYNPEKTLSRDLGSRLIGIESDMPADLTNACLLEDRPDGWVLFVMTAKLEPDDIVRTYFETAPEPVGLFVEYDTGLLRLGLGLGPESPESNAELPIRWVRRNERITVAIGVTREQTRLITNGKDLSIRWPGQNVARWRCNEIRIGDDIKPTSSGFTCKGCEVQLRYASGEKIAELDAILDSLSNVRRFNLLRFGGTGLVVAGVAFIALASRRKREPALTTSD